jgi:hypothetical protein
MLHFHLLVSSRAGTIGQLVVNIPNGVSLTPPHKTKKKKHQKKGSEDKSCPCILLVKHHAIKTYGGVEV